VGYFFFPGLFTDELGSKESISPETLDLAPHETRPTHVIRAACRQVTWSHT